METVDFYPKTFHQIPEQDNPAFGQGECVMIVRECLPTHNSERAVVLHIVPDPDESVTSVAVFWRHERAIAYANVFVA